MGRRKYGPDDGGDDDGGADTIRCSRTILHNMGSMDSTPRTIRHSTMGHRNPMNFRSTMDRTIRRNTMGHNTSCCGNAIC